MTEEAPSLRLSHTEADERRESLLVWGIAGWLALIQISIAASQLVLALTFVVWLHRMWTGKVAFVSLPIDLAVALYTGWSLLAAAFSFDPFSSAGGIKKLVLLVILYLLVSSLRRAETLERLVLLLIVMADVGALTGLWQYRFGDLGDLNHRIRGFMGHYMTYSGLLMGVSLLALAQLLFRRKGGWFALASLGLILPALALTLTRSAWIGMLLGAIFLLYLRDRRLLVLVPTIVLGLYLVAPANVERRVRSVARPGASGRDRVHMAEAGLRMISAHPLLGVGPGLVDSVYPVYVAPEAPRFTNPHLHNNFIQIAAERGLPCLLAWMWLMWAGGWAAWRSYGSAEGRRERALSAGALGAILAVVTAGMLEYTFGDSEVQMLLLFCLAVPFILARDPVERAPGEDSSHRSS